VTRPRAADDFATIRARMEELRRDRAPLAADNFAAIRARMEELRRERAQMSATRDARSLRPRPCGPSANVFSRAIRQRSATELAW
jgi:ElaB/YqjD/DUF883 family membrane-anchored ribosome-binding protein